MRARITWRYLWLLVGLAFGLSGPGSRPLSASRTPTLNQANGNYKVPHSFEENQGQTDRQVEFLARGNGYTLFLTATEAVLSLRRRSDAPQPTTATPQILKPTTADRLAQRHRQPLLLRLQPVGANASPRIIGDSPLPGTVHYVRGKSGKASLTGVRTYRRVRYEDVYAGVDLVYYHTGDELEYDFIVAPGANPDRIRLRFSGADRLDVDANGDLVLHTAVGELRQPAPVIYQQVGGVRNVIAGSYILENDDQVRFRVGPYDRTRPLVIDPVLSYSTYFGGSGEDVGMDIAVDAEGNAYVTGARPTIRSVDAYDDDAFVAKFSATGELLWVTDLGDTCDDQGRGLTLDGAANVYVTGALGNCYPFPTLHAGAFVAKLNASGGTSYMFPFSDYWYGGADVGQAVAVDGAGRAYVTGITTSAEFPITPGAFQETFAGGIGDGFVVKVDAAGSTLLHASYLGGTAYESLNDIALDSGGRAYVVGSTESQDFPTRNALQPVHPGWGPGDTGGFVTKLAPDLSTLVYSTYLGGGPMDIAQSVAVDALGNAYIAGVTESSEFPITPGVVQPLPGDNRWCYYRICTDGFVTKLNAAGTALVYSTYLGADLFDSATGIAVDSAGNAYVTGNTLSFEFPTVAAFQPAGAGGLDAFVTKLNSSGSAFIYSSYLGGSPQSTVDFEGEDAGLRIAVEPTSGSAYVIGNTRSPDFPVVNGHQAGFGGGQCGITGYRCSDAFITKIGASCTFSIAPMNHTAGAGGGAATVSVTASSNACPWTATSGVAWIGITSGATGTGNGVVGYSVTANAGAAQRTGTLNIAGRAFTVTQAAAPTVSVMVTAPNGGEKLFAATPYTISWTAAGATGFDVAASADGGASYSPIPGCVGLPGNARSCTWMAPGPATLNGRIRLTAYGAGGNVSDVSNAAFSIVSGAASLSVTFPNTAVNVGIGSTQQIKWSHNLGTQSFVRVELSRDGGVTFPETLAAAHRNNLATSGTYNWLVTGPATAGARIRVSWTDGAAADSSNTSFVIAPAFINVVAPAPGGLWTIGAKHTIIWTSNLGKLENVAISLSKDGGATYPVQVAGSTASDGKQAVTVKAAWGSQSGTRLKITWLKAPTVAGVSADFTIQP
jgi:Beta-propeller repeat